MPNGIREVNLDIGEHQLRQEVTVVFGDQYGLRILDDDGEVTFRLVTIHHPENWTDFTMGVNSSAKHAQTLL